MQHVPRVLAVVSLVAASAALTGSSAGHASPACADATITGTAGDDTLRGTDGPDVIDGGAGDDRLLGLGGDDVLCGGDGQDVLLGGGGADHLDGGRDAKVAEDNDYWVYYGDELAGGPGDDLLLPGGDPRAEGPHDTVSYLRSATGVVVDLAAGTATGEGTDTILGPVKTLAGSRHDDRLLGSDADDRISGVAGADVIEGRGGTDFITSEVGFFMERPPVDRDSDVLGGGDGPDEVVGGRGDDTLSGGRGRDALYGARGADVLRGGVGDDALRDTFEPRPGQRVVGGAGRDALEESFFATPDQRQGDIVRDVTARLDLAAERLVATFAGVRLVVPVAGVEDANTLVGRWTMLGTSGPNHLLGDDRRGVVLRGRGGDDDLVGSFGDDVIDGGPGRDRGIGWVGRDRYRSIEVRR